METKTMKRLSVFLAALSLTAGLDAQPTWPRKYAIAVVRGRLINAPRETKEDRYTISASGSLANTNIKGEMIRRSTGRCAPSCSGARTLLNMRRWTRFAWPVSPPTARTNGRSIRRA